MKQWADIRKRVLKDGVSKRQIIRETGMHWKTLEKILIHSSPPGYQRSKPISKPKLDPFVDVIKQIIAEDKLVKKKQRHTAKRIFDRIKNENGFTGSYNIVRQFVAELKRTSKEVFMPLAHPPGHAQVDFFEALAKIDGKLCKVKLFAMVPPFSDAIFITAFHSECTETFWEGHLRAFDFFGGVPILIKYDNSKVAVKTILGAHTRNPTDGFLQLASHYLFDYHFCTVRRPNEKGVVEKLGSFARQNFMVPVPKVKSLDELNEHLLDCCRADLARKLRGKKATKYELLEEERAHFLPLPSVPFDACRKRITRSNSLSMVRFNTNDYSVPVDYAYHKVVVKGYCDRVVICKQNDIIADHERIWEKEQASLEPRHYLPLLARKPGALDHGLPLMELELPECFEVLRRRLENDAARSGTKEFIRILRLLENNPKENIKQSVKRLGVAIDKALGTKTPTADVVKMYLYPSQSPEAAIFPLDGREHLKGIAVAGPDISAYDMLRSDKLNQLEEGA